VPRSRFWTEAELMAMNRRARAAGAATVPYPRTPDVLFRRGGGGAAGAPVLVNGRPCSWLDSKNMLLVPGVSEPQEVEGFLAQVDAYCELFGPGAVVWHRPFLEDLADLLAQPAQVAMFTVEASPGSKEAVQVEKQRQRELRCQQQQQQEKKTTTMMTKKKQKPHGA
jgi:hypothetical protein